MISHPMAEQVLCCFSLSLLLAKNRFVLSDLAGRLGSCQVLGHCISWSRGIENTVNISSLQMPGCSFSVSQAIWDGRARGNVCGGGGREGEGGGGEGRPLPTRRVEEVRD